MYQCSADPTGRILAVTWSGFVGPEEVQACVETVRGLAGTVKPGFVLFTEMTHVKSMDPECAPILGQLMEECTVMGLSASVRVVPAEKDIGLNLIARFHYPPEVRSHTYETLSDALHALVAEVAQKSES